jgi:hypothetical protein
MLNVVIMSDIMLNLVILSVIMLNVVILSVIIPSIPMPILVLLSVAWTSVNILRVNTLIVILQGVVIRHSGCLREFLCQRRVDKSSYG